MPEFYYAEGKAGCANDRTEQEKLKERREEIYPLTVCRYLHYLSTPFTVSTPSTLSTVSTT